jgi:hypothetical protein
MAINLSQMLDDALAFELAGDLDSALRIYYALEGQCPVTSTTKDGLTVSFSETALDSKIKRLEARIASASGSGKLKHVPIQFQRTTSPGDDATYSDGYAWGY